VDLFLEVNPQMGPPQQRQAYFPILARLKAHRNRQNFPAQPFAFIRAHRNLQIPPR